MATAAGPQTGLSTRQRLRVVLTSGDTITSSIEGDEETARRELDAVIASLGTERFVRIGDDTIVRSDEVRMIQLRHEGEGDDGGFLQDLKTKITGGERMTTYDDRQTTQTVYRTDDEGRQGGGWGQGQGGGQQPWIGYGRRSWAETKPFFLTSEFLAFVAGVAAILIAVWQADNFEAPRAWLYVTIVAAAYIVSRGIAKAGTRDPNPNRGGGHGGYDR
jgi:hypothetical protein